MRVCFSIVALLEYRFQITLQTIWPISLYPDLLRIMDWAHTIYLIFRKLFSSLDYTVLYCAPPSRAISLVLLGQRAENSCNRDESDKDMHDKHREIAKSCPEHITLMWRCQVVEFFLLKDVTLTSTVITVTITNITICFFSFVTI